MNPVWSNTRIRVGLADVREIWTDSIATSKVITSPSMAAEMVEGVRRTSECGCNHSTSRTSGPATRSSSGATRGPTPLRDVTGVKSGKRISGRMIGA